MGKKDRQARKGKKPSKAVRGAGAASSAAAGAASERAPLKIAVGRRGYTPMPGNVAKDVHVEDYTMPLEGGGGYLLEKVQLHFSPGHRYGLVGKNGSGKSTLLRRLADYTIEGFPTHVRVLHVAQEDLHVEANVLEAVLKADDVRDKLFEDREAIYAKQAAAADDNAELDRLNDALDKVEALMEQFDVEKGEEKAMRILSGLGFSPEMMSSSVVALSGGWRMRVKLAMALFVEPDLLLLDEPTNHLDFPSVLWLQNYLLTYPNMLVLVSHDRTFLNAVPTNIIHLDKKVLTYYKGTFSAFELIREEHRRALEREYKAKHIQIEALKEYIRKFRDRGEKQASQVQSKGKELAKLEAEQVDADILKAEREFTFKFDDVEEIETALITMENVSFGYSPDRLLLENLNLRLWTNSRIGVLGANGVGKTTLIKLIQGALKPVAGEITRDSMARISQFTQHHMDQLNLEMTATEHLMYTFRDELSDNKDRIQRCRGYLGRFQITGDQQMRKLHLLSGGQKSRVCFATLCWKKPHFIIMDEPTNHLDLESVDSLVGALEEFKGGLLAISHDQYFLQKVCTEYWAVTREGIQKFEDFDDAKDYALKHQIGAF